MFADDYNKITLTKSMQVTIYSNGWDHIDYEIWEHEKPRAKQVEVVDWNDKDLEAIKIVQENQTKVKALLFSFLR